MTDDPEITDPRDPYRRPDIVTELDRYLVRDETVGFTEMVQRARDEIVALRAQQEAVRGIAGNERRLSEAIAQQAREHALEEAVQACTDQISDDPPPGTYNDACEDCAAAIRALKKKR